MQSKFSAPAAPDLRAANEGRGPFTQLANLGTEEELPPPETKRWVIRRKAIVVAAVRSGLLTLEEACERYKLSIEEFLSWQRLIDSHGLAGLRVTRLQDYRGAGKAR
jgi:uncharacterized protein DUF1153